MHMVMSQFESKKSITNVHFGENILEIKRKRVSKIMTQTNIRLQKYDEEMTQNNIIKNEEHSINDSLYERKGMGQKVQIQLNKFYYNKVWYTHSMLVLILTVQLIIFSFTKITEIKFWSYVDTLDEKRRPINFPVG